jgi:16S rRNA (guanine(1405)-N(7))-methyltransferase
LNPKTVDRVVQSSNSEKDAKKKLHQIWGAYYSSIPKFKKLEDKSVDDLLRIHSSTNERMGDYPEFYKRIFEITGVPRKITDIACGFNPLAYKYIREFGDIEYVGIDIDVAEVEFINIYMEESPEVSCKVGDVFDEETWIEDANSSDILLLLKLLPVLEQQTKGTSQDFINKLTTNHLIISFPTKSISGKEKGMTNNYLEWFRDLETEKYEEIGELEFEREVILILKKKREAYLR